MFSIATNTIDAASLTKNLSNSTAGAMVTFEGWVRDHNEGKSVLALEYEAYVELCEREAQNIFAETKARFDIIDLACVHRTGALKIGEMAVWVGVTAAHRADAFEACRFVIDEIKSRLPIWKKETYKNGSSGWVNCQNAQLQAHAHEEASTSR